MATRNPELIVALDTPTAQEAAHVVSSLGETVSFYKVGLELYCAEGRQVLELLSGQNKRVFLDLKLHDIPRTVARTVSVLAKLNVQLLTLHATGARAMLEAAAEAARAAPNPPELIAVTCLTSLDGSDLSDIGVMRNPPEQAVALGKLAVDAGIDGLVTSPLEVTRLREALGPEPLLVTPGIRPAGGETGDQKRVATPAMAVSAGANYLVVGRPILEADDPAAAAQAIVQEMRGA